MTKTTDGVFSVNAYFALFGLTILLSVGEWCRAQTQTFCGTKKCAVSQDAQGNYYAEFWCKGSYPISGTCSPPVHQTFFEQDPAMVGCCNGGRCGAGSTITSHLTCAGDSQTASYTVNCVASGGPAYVTVNSTLSCCITCDPHGGGGGGCETTDLDYDGWDACEDCDDSYYDPYNQCNGTFCPSCAFDEDCYECDLTSYCAASRCWTTTPILIDIKGDGYHLTSAAAGVAFDMSGYGSPQALSWTAAGSDDAWLVLDRNGNGLVDNGKELFGSATPQAHSGNTPNGFNALAHYDRAIAGGNGDGVIDSRDAIFSSLRLWQDLNHNGISEPNELHTLPELGVYAIALDFKESRQTDQYGNRFRYRAKVFDARGQHVGRWAWDVSLVPLR